MIFRALGLTLCCAPIFAQQVKPVLSTEPISAERMEIYRDFLTGYNNGSKSILNLADVTVPVELDDGDLKGCLKAFRASDLKVPTVHNFSSNAFPTTRVRLVDPEKRKRRDPGDAIRNGAPLDDSVERGFAAGLFSFSEIAFDKAHTHAAFNYSFVCGRLCGHGGTVIYELEHGKWKPSKAQCGHWIS